MSGGTGAHAAPPAAPAAQTSLDEVMLAMDVVDTLRHDDALVAQELNKGARETQLRERLRALYRGQGIEVPDRVIDEGIRALAEQRFVYTPPAPSFQVTLARLYVRRDRYLRAFAIGLGVVVAAGFLWQAAFVWPQQAAEEAARIELTETLPQDLQRLHGAVTALAEADDARSRADTLLAEGRAALARGEADGARAARDGLAALETVLSQSYTVRVVSRPGVQSGVWRVPDSNRSARNYYLIVEAIEAGGDPVPRSITSEEDGATRTVTRWGQRVDEALFEAVRRDKTDDGILQNDALGEKRRGRLAPEFRAGVREGAILEW